MSHQTILRTIKHDAETVASLFDVACPMILTALSLVIIFLLSAFTTK